MSPAGSDRNPCTLGAPCASLDASYGRARPGDTVHVASGTYSDTSLQPDPSKAGASSISFVAMGAKPPSFSRQLTIGASHVTLRGMSFPAGVWIGSTASMVTIRSSTVRAFKVVSSGSRAPTNISFIADSMGPASDDNNIIGSDGPSTTASPTHILLQGVRIHDYRLSPGSAAHVDCLQVWAVNGLTIRDSRFSDCEVFDIFLQKLPGGRTSTPTNILIENNFLDCCRSGFYSIYLANHPGASWRNVAVRNNSSDKAFNTDPDVPYANVRFDGNIAPALRFFSNNTDSLRVRPAGVAAEYNVWYAGTRIGRHDLVARSGFLDPGRLNFNLAAHAPAIGHGDPHDYPRTDIGGRTRPDPPDAGAAQHAG
jgi:hypothetical protein